MSSKRILKDYKLISEQPPEGVRFVSQDRLTEWEVEIDGPLDTIWEGGTFRLSVSFPSDYSF